MTWLLHILGLDSASGTSYLAWSGVGGDVTIIAGIVAALRRAARHHRERIAQAAQHHREKLELDAGHHKAHLDLLRRHHQVVMDRADAHHQELKAASAAPTSPAAERLVPASVRKPAARRTTSG